MKSSVSRNEWDLLLDCSSAIKALIRELLEELRATLGDALEGVYLYGSLVAGDFSPEVSDLDLLVAVASEVDDEQLGRLRQLHDSFAREHPDWRDRIDASYVARAGLRTFKERESRIAVISPGEPLDLKQTSPGWLMNWHLVRERGVTLFGPAPRALIAGTTAEDFAAAVLTHLQELPARVAGSRQRGFRVYAILTACRGLYTCSEGQQASKARAARWAAQRYPDWSDVIRKAGDWRNESRGEAFISDDSDSALEFVRFAARQLASERASGS